MIGAALGAALGGVLQPVFVGDTVFFQRFEHAVRINPSGLTVKWQHAPIGQVQRVDFPEFRALFITIDDGSARLDLNSGRDIGQCDIQRQTHTGCASLPLEPTVADGGAPLPVRFENLPDFAGADSRPPQTCHAAGCKNQLEKGTDMTGPMDIENVDQRPKDGYANENNLMAGNAKP